MRTRTTLAAVAVLAAGALLPSTQGQAPPGRPEAGIPATGKLGPGLEPLDRAVIAMMSRHGIPGAALAVARDGKLVLARSFGWADLATREQVQPDTRFGIASLSKAFTAVAVLKLVEEGKLRLDDKAFVILKDIRPFPGARVDPRLYRITVRQLLNHSGGWDTKASGDPVNWTTQVQLKRGDRTPISAAHLIAFTMGIPLDFDPGTDSKYSNFGYIVLGEVIAKASGQPYEKYVRERVLAPMGVRNASLHPLGGRYFRDEARRYLAGTDTQLPAWQQKYSDAAGGWTASAVDLALFLTALDGSRQKSVLDEKTFRQMIALPPPPLKARPNGTHVGLGWDSVVLNEPKGFGYYKDGSWFGMRSFMKRNPNGVNWVLLFNASMQPDVDDSRIVGDAVKEVHAAVERMEKYPALDLFKEFR
ncbi:MAG TPA: serine hydrolase domain-containing protein [Gemmataceae bacterium]|nr:serine hydrolase domain-containing protein [Gemmataceae bacterium]